MPCARSSSPTPSSRTTASRSWNRRGHMRIAVLRFPGSNCDDDALAVVSRVLGEEGSFVWHKETALPPATDAVIVPGGFSYGDYLRAGAIAAHSRIMDAVRVFAAEGKPVLGICNGFQILCESG